MNEPQNNPPDKAAGGKEPTASMLMKLWANFQAALWAVVPVIVLMIMIVLVIREIHQDTIEVAPIQVPTSLAETGLTPEVVALRLLDQIAAAERVVTSERVVRPNVELVGQNPISMCPSLAFRCGPWLILRATLLASPRAAFPGKSS